MAAAASGNTKVAVAGPPPPPAPPSLIAAVASGHTNATAGSAIAVRRRTFAILNTLTRTNADGVVQRMRTEIGAASVSPLAAIADGIMDWATADGGDSDGDSDAFDNATD